MYKFTSSIIGWNFRQIYLFLEPILTISIKNLVHFYITSVTYLKFWNLSICYYIGLYISWGDYFIPSRLISHCIHSYKLIFVTSEIHSYIYSKCLSCFIRGLLIYTLYYMEIFIYISYWKIGSYYLEHPETPLLLLNSFIQYKLYHFNHNHLWPPSDFHAL